MTTIASSTKSPSKSRRSLKGTKTGIVCGDRREKTRVVSVSYQVRHPKYGKYLKRNTRFHVHDPENTSHVGDLVEIANCRPISKTKMWRLVRVIRKGEER